MDMQALRWVPAAGLYFHVWNLFDALRHEGTHKIVPFLYGHPALVESEQVRSLRKQGLHRHLRYYWDGPTIPLASGVFGPYLSLPPQPIRSLDRRLIYRAWRRWHRRTRRQDGHEHRSSRRLRDIDLFHHVELPLFPLEAFPVNVMTIPDLTTLRVPTFHQQENIDLMSDIVAVAPRMDMVITESEHTKKDVTELLGIDADRVRVTPLAAHRQFRPVEDPAGLRAVMAKYDLHDRPYILTIGTLEPRKNHKRLVEAFARLKSQGNLRDYHLALIGGKGWLYDEIFETIRQHGLESHIRWLGYVPFEELPVLLSGATAFVYPSLYEGFGLPPLEAMSCGTAVITSNTTSIPEVVGDAAVTVDPTDTDAIAAAIQHVTSHTDDRQALRAKSLARAATFTWERTARLTLDAYEEARRRSRNRPEQGRVAAAPGKCREHMKQWVLDQLHVTFGRA
jgi:glycosyltransferase involved in cell wall biosynthesis